jgi:hypothetical protein
MVQMCAEGRHNWKDVSEYMGQRKYECTVCGATGSGY